MSALITQLNTYAGNYERINLFPNSHEGISVEKNKFFNNLPGNSILLNQEFSDVKLKYVCAEKILCKLRICIK